MMSEHLAGMNERLTEQKDEIDMLRYQLQQQQSQPNLKVMAHSIAINIEQCFCIFEIAGYFKSSDGGFFMVNICYFSIIHKLNPYLNNNL